MLDSPGSEELHAMNVLLAQDNLTAMEHFARSRGASVPVNDVGTLALRWFLDGEQSGAVACLSYLPPLIESMNPDTPTIIVVKEKHWLQISGMVDRDGHYSSASDVVRTAVDRHLAAAQAGRLCALHILDDPGSEEFHVGFDCAA